MIDQCPADALAGVVWMHADLIYMGALINDADHRKRYRLVVAVDSDPQVACLPMLGQSFEWRRWVIGDVGHVEIAEDDADCYLDLL